MRRLMVLLATVIAQIAGAADIQVSAEIVGSGKLEASDVELPYVGFPKPSKDTGIVLYDIRATITNVSKRDLHFAIWSCGWSYSFRVEPRDGVSIDPWDCDGNDATTLDIRQGEKAVFRFQLTGERRRPIPQRVRIGFVAEPGPWRWLDMKEFGPGLDPKSPVVWSDWFQLPPAGEKYLAISHARESSNEEPEKPSRTPGK
jgi:hypothetical protein